MPFRFIPALLLSLLVLVGGCGGLGETDDGTNTPPEEVAPVNGYPSQPARIYVDERSDDWDSVGGKHTDPTDEGATVDLKAVSAAHTSQYLFLRLEVREPMNLQEGNELTLHLDTDNDLSTGQVASGIGAEISWTFGERSGQVTAGGQSEEIGHADIGLTSLPTVRSSIFEVALDRSAEPPGVASLSESDSIRIALSSAGDRLPDGDGGYGYVFSPTDVDIERPSIERSDEGALRVLSYNVRRDALFDSNVHPQYGRILRAVQPDVVGFQEVYEHTAGETGDVVSDLLSGASDWDWSKAGPDLVVGSRYPILATDTIPGYEDSQSAAARIDADERLGSDLLVVVMHPPCCNYGPEEGEPSRNAQRQEVVDGVSAFLRDVKQGEGPFGVPPETPIVIVGDMNFVGKAQQPRTLRTGEIVNTDRFGSSAAPDWDDSPLLDTNPRQTATPVHTTWINAESSFPPGRLDYAYVSDSVLDVVREYVLYTPALSDSVLNQFGLETNDTREASDHLPVVIDVAPR